MCKRYSSPHKHEGVDIGTAIGTPVVAPFDGKIIKVKTGSKSAGNYIVLKTKEERPIFHTFMHLGDNLPTINQEFKSGDVVAYVGRTGAGTGAHLHWETSMGLLRKKFDPLSLYQKRSLQEWKNAELNRLLLEKFNLGDKK
jgi:murein DD-endopeptidase MepM/ murein hydrolase activator NlpD